MCDPKIQVQDDSLLIMNKKEVLWELLKRKSLSNDEIEEKLREIVGSRKNPSGLSYRIIFLAKTSTKRAMKKAPMNASKKAKIWLMPKG